MKNVLAMVLAGGKGERLHPLTLHHAKPAVPFGGQYRIIDFTLSNCLNSNIRKVAVLIQYMALSLARHLRHGWDVLNHELGEFVISFPPQRRISQDWYKGTADAVYQNLFLAESEGAEYLLILAGDHIYKMNYQDMYDYLQFKKADAVVAAIEFPLEEAGQFGVIQVDPEFRIMGFDEKPKNPAPLPNDPTCAFVSMGVYLFKTRFIQEFLLEDAKRRTDHDFGKNILPQMINKGGVFAYNFKDENKKAVKYWRDIGTLDAYWEANMDLVSVDPLFNLYDQDWPIRTYQRQCPPAKFVFAQESRGGRLGIALDSIVSGGCILSGGRVQDSVLSPNVRVNDLATVYNSILMENVVIGEGCRIKRAIIDNDVTIPPNTEIGLDLEADRRRFTVTESGLVVITKDMKFKGTELPRKSSLES